MVVMACVPSLVRLIDRPPGGPGLMATTSILFKNNSLQTNAKTSCSRMWDLRVMDLCCKADILAGWEIVDSTNVVNKM